jgi:hypothetical protein
MFITEKLKELKKELLETLSVAEQNAKTEAQFDELEDICEGLICGMPITIIQKDYYRRSDIKTYLADDEKQDTEFVNSVMKQLYERDTIAFCYDCVNQAIQDDIAEIPTKEVE